MPNHRLPKGVLFSMPNSEWRKQRGGQPMTWQRSMKEITKRLGAVGATRLPGWGPQHVLQIRFCMVQLIPKYIFLVVDQVAVDLCTELGNRFAKVSSPYEETSSVRS
ncbi:hypothetical protein T265_04094 [Opisthorchis viverrini]|uniref:Uncharacterized protein n=1 Tax=Opisthorchis viverrini TaxID=6198 RepID=A0A074ZPA8_OPIVI|nr:hypothetical protein T265_04094 [Opisthorchis viverrini]KER29248.1 hypothetical protein T265_04094 [Opisthorchis viverrini]